MKELNVKYLHWDSNTLWNQVFFQELNEIAWNEIQSVNWSKYSYKPTVRFKIAYCDFGLILQYQVEEKSIRAKAVLDNEDVWKDSCVEFFIAPQNDGIYYNFEFNCAGVCLLAAGNSRNGREKAPLSLVGQIIRYSDLNKKPPFDETATNTPWTLFIAIPYVCFFKHPGFIAPKKQTLKANFYKCGDDLAEPHYLSWNPIQTEKPDFHRPEFFGSLYFE